MSIIRDDRSFLHAIKPGDDIKLNDKIVRLEGINILKDRAAVSWQLENGERHIERAVLSDVESQNGPVDWFAELGCLQYSEEVGVVSAAKLSDKKRAIVERIKRCVFEGSAILG
jgi:hypothetical protein